jgi:hypothetical protein
MWPSGSATPTRTAVAPTDFAWRLDAITREVPVYEGGACGWPCPHAGGASEQAVCRAAIRFGVRAPQPFVPRVAARPDEVPLMARVPAIGWGIGQVGVVVETRT